MYGETTQYAFLAQITLTMRLKQCTPRLMSPKVWVVAGYRNDLVSRSQKDGDHNYLLARRPGGWFILLYTFYVTTGVNIYARYDLRSYSLLISIKVCLLSKKSLQDINILFES